MPRAIEVWLRYLRERFSPLTYLSLIVLFVSAHVGVYLSVSGIPFSRVDHVAHVLPLGLGVLAFFLSLRLFDDVKDARSDRMHYPDRPIPRGSISEREVVRAAFLMLGVQIVTIGSYGMWAFVGTLVVVGYTLLMYREFFIGAWLRTQLTLYALSHTIVVVLMSFSVFTAFYEIPAWQLPSQAVYFAIIHWFLFSLFEFVRKTFSSHEERDEIDSYSKLFGRHGAVVLSLLAIAPSVLVIHRFIPPIGLILVGGLIASVALCGVRYVIYDKPTHAALFRGMAASYIPVFYALILITISS